LFQTVALLQPLLQPLVEKEQVLFICASPATHLIRYPTLAVGNNLRICSSGYYRRHGKVRDFYYERKSLFLFEIQNLK
jgi:hypothetical protein